MLLHPRARRGLHCAAQLWHVTHRAMNLSAHIFAGSLCAAAV
jgi:hypothetical protein